jgi:hypothetical protein
LRQGAFDARTALVALQPLLTGIPGTGLLQRFKVLPRREMETAPRLCSPGAERPRVARPAVLEAEAHERRRLALPIDILPPDGRDLALRAPGLLLLPIDRELGEIVGPFGMGLPPLDRPHGATQGDPVLLLAGNEHVRTDLSAIDEMLVWRQVFRAEGLVNGCRALGLIDRSGGRVHLREQVGRGRLTRLADMHHRAGPRRVAFLSVARFRIVG